jgi:hypothetical protein
MLWRERIYFVIFVMIVIFHDNYLDSGDNRDSGKLFLAMNPCRHLKQAEDVRTFFGERKT